jgi:hypothetical protein
VDTNRDGTIDAADELNEDVWSSTSGAVFIANLDDDDNNGSRDGGNTVRETGDASDLAPLIMRKIENVRPGDTARLVGRNTSTDIYHATELKARHDLLGTI